MYMPGPPSTRTICRLIRRKAENNLPPKILPTPAYSATKLRLLCRSDGDSVQEGLSGSEFETGERSRESSLWTESSGFVADCGNIENRSSRNREFELAITVIMDRRIIDDRGVARFIVFDPTEIARALQLPSKLDPRFGRITRTCSVDEASMVIDRLAKTLEAALDPSRPGRESLLICKAVTDAYLVNAKHLRHIISSGSLSRTLRNAWRHAVEHWNDGQDEPHSAADLHLVS